MREPVDPVDSSLHLYLVRHAEARKNVEGRQGGKGSKLTAEGERHAQGIGASLTTEEQSFRHKAVVYCHSTPQVRQTAYLVAKPAGWRAEVDEDLRGLDLGDLAGLTFEEARQLDASAVDRLEAWVRGTLPVDQLQLPGGEPIAEFRERVAGCLDRILGSDGPECPIIIGTTSTLIMLCNILTLGPRFRYEDYRPYSFPNGSATRWTLSGGSVIGDVRVIPVAVSRSSQ